MAQVIRFEVAIKTEEEARRIERALAQLNSAGIRAGRAAPVAMPRMVAPSILAARGLGAAIGSSIRAPFDVLSTSVRLAGSSLVSFLGPMATLGVAAGATAPTLLALGVVVVSVAPALFSLAATIKLMRASFGWAKEAADAQLQILARTKRDFPGVIGEAFDRAEDTTLVKLGVGSALFGKAADAMAEGITRRFTEAQMGRGIRGEKDIFERLGITPEAMQAYEEIRGGERVGLTDWLALFIRKREQLDVQQTEVRGTPAEAQVRLARAGLIDDSLKLFGQRFADIVGSFTSEDLKQLSDNIKATLPLVAVADADQKARDFDVALLSLKETFNQLQRGIAGDLQPVYTEMMEGVRKWLLSAGDDGQTIGQQLRQLASSVALHGWETLRILLSEIKPDDVKSFVDEMKKWQPERSIAILTTAARLLGKLANLLGHIPEAMEESKIGTRLLEAERERARQKRGGVSSWTDYLPPFIPGAPGYESVQPRPRIGGRTGAPVFRGPRKPYYDTLKRFYRKYGRLPDEPGFATVPPTAPSLAPTPISLQTGAAVVAPTNAAGALRVAPGYAPLLGREDPRVMDALTRAQAFLPPGYTAKVTSGFRSNNPKSQHATGTAIDIQIFDDKGRPIANKGEDRSGLYTRYARAAYGVILDRHPELAGRFNWGGAHGTSSANPWTPDLMHFDIGGVRGRIARYRLDRLGPLRAGEPVTAALMPTVQPTTQAAGSSAVLTSLRQPLLDEVNRDPATKRLLYQMMATEGGGAPTVEALFNRVAMVRQTVPGYSIRDELRSGFYGPIRSGKAQATAVSAGEQIRYDSILHSVVFGGSNIIQGRTNQGNIRLGDPGTRLPGRVYVPETPSEVYNFWEGRRGGVEFGTSSSARFAADLQAKLAQEERDRLTAKPPEKVLQEGTAAGDAAARAFKEGIEDVKIPIKSLSDEEKEREKKRAEREQAAAL